MWTDHLKHAALALLTIALAAAGPTGLGENENMSASAGVVQVRSIYGVEETTDRIKQDIAGKGITFFTLSISPSWRQLQAFHYTPRYCWFSVTPPSAHSSSHQIQSLASIGRCGSSFTRMSPARCGRPIQISIGLHSVTT